jgi:hypothetical protein
MPGISAITMTAGPVPVRKTVRVLPSWVNVPVSKSSSMGAESGRFPGRRGQPVPSPPMIRSRWPVALFVPWTLFVWFNRVVNTMGDDEANKPLTLALALSVVVPVVAVGVVLVQARARRLSEGEGRLLQAAAIWTVLVWLVRGAEIGLSSEHGAAFKVVHLVIGVVSVSLALVTARIARDELAVGVSPPVGVGR